MVSRHSCFELRQLKRRSQPWKWENTTGALNHGHDDDVNDGDDDDGGDGDDGDGDGDDIFTGDS